MNKHLPLVIHVHEMADDFESVYVGRAVPRRKLAASKWANPHKITPTCDRSEAIRRYSADLRMFDLRHLLLDIHELRDVAALACWCRHAHEDVVYGVNECHADVLVRLLGHDDYELRQQWITAENAGWKASWRAKP